MDKESLEYFKKINKNLFKKNRLAKTHLEKIEKDICNLEIEKTKILKNKELDDKEKKTKLSELTYSIFKKMKYHLSYLNSHLLADNFSVEKYILENEESLADEKLRQLDEGVSLGFITAEQAAKKKEKWDLN